jgi:cell division septal protein FtsQ
MGVFLLAFVVGLSILALYTGAHAMLTSAYFSVKRIGWEGLTRPQTAVFQTWLQPVVGRNLFRLDTDYLQTALLAHPWVKTVQVKKIFPDRIHIRVTERTPAAVQIDEKGRLLLRDEEGRTLSRGGEYPASLPRLIRFQPEGYANALALGRLTAERPEAQIDLSDLSDLRVHLGNRVIHFGRDDYPERWRRFLVIESELASWGSEGIDVDLRFNEKVIIRLIRPVSERYL